MNEIILSNTAMPTVSLCNHIMAHEDFYHIDRTASFHILIYVVKGTIYVTEADIDYEIKAGELIFFKSGLRHYGKRKIKEGTEWYFIHFCNHESNRRDLSVTLPKMLSGLSESVVSTHIAKLCKLALSENNMDRWNLNSKLFQLLSETAFYNQSLRDSETLSDKICAYLSEHYAEPFSSAALEEKFFLSYKHISFVFKKEKFMTIKQFHTKVKMEKAQKLLKHTMLSVGEVSQTVGYNDSLYFSRCFHAYTGISPTEYRKLPEKY